MPSFLFWNLNKKQLGNEVASLCHKFSIDVLILAECEMDEVDLQLNLNTQGVGSSTYLAPPNNSPRLKFLTKLPHGCFLPLMDEGGISIWKVAPPVGVDFLLVGAHLRSKLHMSEHDQMFSATRVRSLIANAEDAVGHHRTVVIGDLNMNPFESAMVSAEGMHGVQDRQIAARGSRVVEGATRKFFYNPMWGRMGDNSSGPPGTYYKDMSDYVNYYWNTFDQVLLRPDLLDSFDDKDLIVISEVDNHPLLSANRINKDFSDHLPIFLSLNTEAQL